MCLVVAAEVQGEGDIIKAALHGTEWLSGIRSDVTHFSPEVK